MILINSAQFIVSDLQAEFGRIPPTFLPFGNRRLFELQVEELARNFPQESIYLSLPNEFNIPQFDLALIHKLGLNILKHPESLSLGESVLKSLREIQSYPEVVRILHGDTLIFDLPRIENCISISVPSSEQNWFYEYKNEYAVWNGYFSFSNQNLLIDQLEGKSNFEKSVKGYDDEVHCPRVMSDSWLDFGHVSTYYRARVDKLIKRSFNEISYDLGLLKKTGAIEKIQAEINWYQNVPGEIRILLPQHIEERNSTESNSYRMEYLPIPSLAEIFVFGNNSKYFWLNISELLEKYFTSCQALSLTESQTVQSQLIHTELMRSLGFHVSQRLDHFEQNNHYFNRGKSISVNGSTPCSIDSIVNECLEQIANSLPIFGVQHGDLCLSNILFEVRTNRIRLIDPRGLDFDGEKSLFGDLRYDFAKLAHSFLGFYDHIIADRFEFLDLSTHNDLVYCLNIQIEDSKIGIADDFFFRFLKDKSFENSCIAYMVLLFITMAPLHAENSTRQKVLLSNSVMLFHKYLRRES